MEIDLREHSFGRRQDRRRSGLTQMAGNTRIDAAMNGVEVGGGLWLFGVVFIVALVELLQCRGARRIANHGLSIVSKLAHHLEKFPLPTYGCVDLDAGEK